MEDAQNHTPFTTTPAKQKRRPTIEPFKRDPDAEDNYASSRPLSMTLSGDVAGMIMPDMDLIRQMADEPQEDLTKKRESDREREDEHVNGKTFVTVIYVGFSLIDCG
jgi:hypothetical protein